MKKVLIHTINDDANFGNRLQNFALQHVLNTRYNVTAVTQQTNSQEKYYSLANDMRQWLLGRVINTVLKSKTMPLKKSWMWRKRNSVFRDFTKQFVPKAHDSFDESTVDTFVVGSDQVWNPEFRNYLEADFLPNVPKSKKIAYAASIGANPEKLSYEEKDVFRKNIQTFASVSMREQDATQFIDDMYDGDVTTVLDPTLLVDKKVWEELASKSKFVVQRPYVLTYFLGSLSSEKRKYIETLANKNNAEVIEINNPDKTYFGEIGPLEFLYLMQNSLMNFTDSFHAVVFSLINEKPFQIFSRVDAGINKSMNSRLDTLLHAVELQDRWKIDDFDKFEMAPINYKEVNHRIQNGVQNSIFWLDQALNKQGITRKEVQ
ncbi:polysaccharide pyruvyl transferase family protein [Weissella sp. GP1]|uniref:polysaccharide pyruvyl transferase family protein n=1 Tax=Weissella confusa TaxID=1583 RepID=UPI0032DAB4A0